MVALGAGHAGCSSRKVEITQSYTTAPGPIARLSVFISMPEGRDFGVYPGFKKAITSELSSCNVESQVFLGLPPSADAPTAPPATSPAPDAQLIVKARYGRLDSVRVVDQLGNTVDDRGVTNLEADFWMELREQRQDRVTWRAFANVQSEPGSGGGEEFAEAIVARLKSDGVLRRCR
jgi:hypothetical protein